MASTNKLMGRWTSLGIRECSITLVMFSLLWSQTLREALALQNTFRSRCSGGVRPLT